MAYFQPLVSNWIEIEAATAAGLDNFKTWKVDIRMSIFLLFWSFQLINSNYHMVHIEKIIFNCVFTEK